MLTITIKNDYTQLNLMVKPDQRIGDVIKILIDNRQLDISYKKIRVYSFRKKEYVSPDHTFRHEDIYNGDTLILSEGSDAVMLFEKAVDSSKDVRVYKRKKFIFIKGNSGDISVQGFSGRILLEDNLLTISNIEETIYLNGISLDAGSHLINEGDELLIGSVGIVIGRDYIKIYGDAYSTDLKQIEDSRADDFPVYKRSPRIIKNPTKKKIIIEQEPTKEEPNRRGLIQLLISPVIMLGVTVLVSVIIKGGVYIIMSIGFTIATAIVSIVRFVQDRKDLKARNKEREENYRKYLLAKRKEIYKTYTDEELSYRHNYPLFKTLNDMAATNSPRIYERSASDADFLHLSVGNYIGSTEFGLDTGSRELILKKQIFTDEIIGIKDRFAIIKRPEIIDLKSTSLGFIGDKRIILAQLKYYISQLTFFHSYHELQIICAYNEREIDAFNWMRWLPHIRLSGLNCFGLVGSEGNNDQVLGSMQQILKERLLKVTEEKKSSRYLPHYVFIIEDDKVVLDHSVMEYLSRDDLDNIGVSLIYIAPSKEMLPENVKTVISYDNSKEATLIIKDNIPFDRKLELSDISDVDPEIYARNLSVLIHELGTRGHLKESFTFMELYGAKRIEDLDIRTRWSTHNSSESLAVPLGVRAGGEELRLNLHETAHGPHGLIAGTTGSGKSELVQSYILSLAVNFHPYEVGFLLIDYKGGGMANLFKDLPHLLGTITNLDGSESLRALASIQSELRRRQRIFGKYEVNHINAYTELYKVGTADEPLPHLFIISDEFAELKKEQPEFMKELISTARIGRSLGVHLILATQKPAGIVDDQIWSNSKFKICLKVQDAGDSREILHTADAASITQPGRAYLQVGNNEIYELFQSAWSGAMYVEETEEDVTADKRVYRVNDLGQGELINADLKDALGEFSAKETQLDAIVDEIRRIYDEENCPAVKKPWLPMLPDKMYLDSHHRTNDNSRIKPDLRISIGCVDIPELQEQEDYIVDLETQGNIVYVASPGFGKTVFLETVIMNLVQKNRVKDINLYILDFGNNALIGMSSLPHIADYVMLDDIEKYDKFRNIIAKEMRERKRLFAAHMVQNFSVYNEICDEPLKAIVVIIDNYDAIKEMGFEMEEYYTKLTRDGGSLGIYTIITASRSSAVRMATMNNFKNKIAGFSFDEMEAKSLVGRCSYTIPETKGRAYVKTGDNVNIMQIYAPFAFEDEVELGRRITEETEKIRALYPEEEAPHIPMLPEDLSLDNLKAYEKGDNDIVLGLDKENVVSAGIRMNDFPFIILGEAGSGKTNAIRLIMEQLADDVDIHLFDSRSRSLISYKDEVDYIVDVEAMEDFLERLPDEIRYRESYRDALIQGTDEELEKPSPMLIVIDDLDNMYDMADSQMQLVGARLKKAAAAGIMILVSVNVNGFKGQDDFTRYLKGIRNGLLLSQQGYLSIFPVKASDVIKKPEGLLMRDGEVNMIRIAKVQG